MSAEALLTIENLAVAFGDRPVVNGISFAIAQGETLGIVGESGSGKSVSALSILRLLPYPLAHHQSGRILFAGEDLLQAPPARLRQIRGHRIAMIFQEPMLSLNPLHRVERQLTETIRLHRETSLPAARERARELLDLVRIEDPEAKLAAFPHELSGGQRQRVMIAIALANDPDLLIADEPTTALDVTIQAQILELLRDIQARTGMAMLLISHDLGIVRKMANRVIVMRRGDIVESGATADLFAAPRHDYTRHLIAAEPKGAPAPIAAEAPLALKARGLDVRFPIRRGIFRRIVGHVPAIVDAALDLRQGETLGIVGESGSGKTSLGLALLRLVESSGEIVFLGRRIDQLDRRAMRPLRRDAQIVFQDPFGSLSPRLAVGEIVAEGLDLHAPDLSAEARADAVIAALRDVGLDPETRYRFPHEFSGGQRQRIAIARALILTPKLIVLDEPTSALDMSLQAEIVDLLRRLQETRHFAYLFISHDLKVVRAMSHRVIVLKGGRIVETGSAAEIFERPREAYTRALIDAAFALRTRAEAALRQ